MLTKTHTHIYKQTHSQINITFNSNRRIMCAWIFFFFIISLLFNSHNPSTKIGFRFIWKYFAVCYDFTQKLYWFFSSFIPLFINFSVSSGRILFCEHKRMNANRFFSYCVGNGLLRIALFYSLFLTMNLADFFQTNNLLQLNEIKMNENCKFLLNKFWFGVASKTL